MQPLGLGSGSGLGGQNVHKASKTSSSSSPVGSSAVVGAAESQDVVNSRDEKGRTALHFACGMASADIARVLVDAGADLNARDVDECTPLHMAAIYGRCDCVKLLLEHGANVFARERSGWTPREIAMEVCDDKSNQVQDIESSLKVPRGDIELTIRLLADAESKSVDIAAQEKGQKSAAEKSRSIVQSSSFGRQKKALGSVALGNALTGACKEGDVEFVRLLLSGGAQVDARGPDGATPLLAAADGGFVKCVQLLLKYGANADARDSVGVTALIAAAYAGHSYCLEVLLSHGASVEAVSQGGVTALIAAAEGRSGDCTQVLLQAGANVNARTAEGKTALMHAVSHNCVEAAEVLLNKNADINAADGDGYTALHHGAQNNSVESLRLLLERKADITRKCRRGRTPLQDAPKDSEAAKLLEESWEMLESEIAMRQEALLKSFAQEGNEKSTLKKPSTRNVREKKNAKKKKEPADHAKQELLKVAPRAKVADESLLAVNVFSSSGSEVTVDQQASSNLEEDSASDLTTHLFSGGAEDDDEWTRVERKRTAAAGAPQLKLKPQGSVTSGVTSPSKTSKSGETSPSADHLLVERKISGGTHYNKPNQGVTKISKEDDSKAGGSSPWVQPIRRTHSVGHAAPSKPSPSEGKAEDAEEILADRVRRIELELELEQARQFERASAEKVTTLEMLKETNLSKISELTNSLSRAQVTALHAENAKTQMEFRIRDLEAVVSSQNQTIEILQAENAELKFQVIRREEQAATQELSRVYEAGSGSGMVRSASEGSLHSTGCSERAQQDLLPFVPKAGPKTDPVNWFSLVPSPD
ncbi:hypothetical protein KC19_12G183800 [Ceratodon purpureus]|uniref:Uncharacterized protein n=1 Tax=Ceratodon purpureus TaxID=3225 RepID=A0A8T0GA89_CERPU|nr:hypothetical protein KC19_12G183800 [Ceratodon purpureus]